jgi:hypothetical protein
MKNKKSKVNMDAFFITIKCKLRKLSYYINKMNANFKTYVISL